MSGPKSYTSPSTPSSSTSTLKPDPIPPNETTTLLHHDPKSSHTRNRWNLFPPVRRVFFTSLLLSMTFAFTQTSLIYAFRVMTCDEYYKTHDWSGSGDRCSVPAVEGRSAREIAIMSTTTTTSTIANLFISGWFINHFGVKATMFQQTFWAALRNLCQMYALKTGGKAGILIIQSTQVFNVLGSAGGYQIASNVFVSLLVPSEERTKMFGVLTGVIMLGSSLGYTLGGLAFSFYGILAPFQCAFGLLCFCTIFGSLFLPYLPPDNRSKGTNTSEVPKEKKKQSFFAPLKIFIPKKVESVNGKVKRDYNLLLLGAGAFVSVLATGYVHVALQLVGTDAFGFTPSESGMMLSGNLLVKAFFLSICFPRIITHGRRLISHRTDVPTGPSQLEHPETPLEAEEPDDMGAPREDQARQPTDVQHGSTFDLYFLRWSIFIDGLLTGLTTLSTRGWHLYLAAGVLPFASATGSACKGVTLDFVEDDQRADALGAIALIEKIAQVSTISLFGTIFAALSEQGKPTLVFLANGAIAMLAFILLLFVRMPKPDSQGRIALPA
ncbi:hypothetical protein I302_100495 [Kwoniella bestiolae CBS 10118]|uniref:Major facilitator superfamily (MFS) profile domain-containing protein n=1 Tax=Kwoniella bestiolae CBS 10118 TaxID=1296100 RepID=A0A1B9G5B0_9TREE|nr:hypothetical protein I302_03868 [Kwoniella bestiolae CBS 10118]OCF26190.1 hypothetical protein I302_03868 [Kwoniella bestiolae CBS 10118]